MTFQQRFRRLRRKRPDEAVVGVRQVDREVVRLALLATDDHQCLAKIGLRRARSMRQRNEHLPAALRRDPHVVLHDRVAAGECVLRPQPIEDPLRRMLLLGRLALVLFENGVDHAHPRPQLGPLRRFFPPVARRNRIPQHLAYRYAR